MLSIIKETHRVVRKLVRYRVLLFIYPVPAWHKDMVTLCRASQGQAIRSRDYCNASKVLAL